MISTQKCIIASFALIVGIGLGIAIAGLVSVDDVPTYEEMIPIITHTPDAGGFKEALLPLLVTRFGTTTTGYEPHKLLYVYPGLVYEDFQGVEAVNGMYEFRDGFVWYLGDQSAGANTDDISDAGFVTLHRNIQNRLKDLGHVSSVELVALLEVPVETSEETPMPNVEDPNAPVESPDTTVCPMDAKQCADGSFVGRTAPSCAFAACPDELPTSPEEIVCTPEQREAEACIEIYAPVCASYQVQCVTTPCNPVPKSYPNSCFACADNNVISYTDGGACASDPLSSP